MPLPKDNSQPKNAHHDLKNRLLHVDAVRDNLCQTAKSEAPNCQIGGLNCTLAEYAILKAVAENPRITQKALAAQTGISERTINRRMKEMQEKQLLRRVNGKRNGKWELLVDLSGRETP